MEIVYRLVDKPLGYFTFYLGIFFWSLATFKLLFPHLIFPFSSYSIIVLSGFPLVHSVLNQVHMFREPNNKFGTVVSLGSIVKYIWMIIHILNLLSFN